MKSLFTCLLLIIIGLTFTQCKKDSNTDNNPADTTTVIVKVYLPLSVGSSFTYTYLTDSLFSSTHTYTIGSDTSINSKTYKKFISADTATEYFAKISNKYYRYQSIPSLQAYGYENLCLNDSLPTGITWKDSIEIANPLGIPPKVNVVFTYAIAGKNLNYSVNGVSYSNVIHVALTDASIPGLAGGFAAGHYYYAKGIGLIESYIAIQDVSMFGISPYSCTQKLKTLNIK